MKDNLNLWQRCEALGPMEDQGARLRQPHPDAYHILIDEVLVFCVHRNIQVSEFSRAWLADAILQRFEAITKKGGTVLTKDNVVDEVERVYRRNEVPTPEQCKALFEWIAEKSDEYFASRGLRIQTNLACREVVVIDRKTGVGFTLTTESFYGYQGVGQTAPATFAEACNVVGCPPIHALPIPETLNPNPSYIVSSPQDVVTIPVEEWNRMKAATETLSSIFNSPIQPIPFEA